MLPGELCVAGAIVSGTCELRFCAGVQYCEEDGDCGIKGRSESVDRQVRRWRLPHCFVQDREHQTYSSVQNVPDSGTWNAVIAVLCRSAIHAAAKGCCFSGFLGLLEPS